MEKNCIGNPNMHRPSNWQAVLVTLCLICVFQVAILLRPSSPIPAEAPRVRLADLVWKLHDKGLEFRAVSQRPDGLWDNGVYLTTTDKTFHQLTKWPINSDLLDKWSGTVVLMRRDQEGLGEDCLAAGEFVFFGDPELIGKIRKCLLED
jgi:hypothetical protein